MVESYSHYLDYDTSKDDIDFGEYDGPEEEPEDEEQETEDDEEVWF